MADGRPILKFGENESDERLLIEAAQKDPVRFGELYEIHFERVYAYILRRVRDRQEAQDLTSEVFHQALANFGLFQWRGVPFAAWLFRIAANRIADHVQRLARERSVPLEAEPADVAFTEADHLGHLFRMVGRLPEDQRRVITMRFAEDRSIRDIARDLGRTEGAIKQLQFRGLQTLRARMGDRNA